MNARQGQDKGTGILYRIIVSLVNCDKLNYKEAWNHLILSLWCYCGVWLFEVVVYDKGTGTGESVD